MGRKKKSPIKLNNVFIRYLKDIIRNQKNIEKNVTAEPRDMFLINTLSKEEWYPENYEKDFEDFKEYFNKKNILQFPKLKEFAKKYNFNWDIEDILDFVFINNEEDTVTFEKFFPVKVLDFIKLTKFIDDFIPAKNKSISNNKTPMGKTEYIFKTKTLRSPGIKQHDFRGEKYRNPSTTIKIFEELWKNRRHMINNKALRRGKDERFDLFIIKTGLIAGKDSINNKKTMNKMAAKVRGVIKNLRKEGFRISISCKIKNGVLLTVHD